MASVSLRLLAATTRTSTWMSRTPPRRRKFCSSSTRSSLACSYQRHLADFVQEDGSAGRDFEDAGLGSPSVRERAFFVAEQFAFEQRLGNSGAVERHEGSFVAAAVVMDELREDVFAGAALAFEQYGGDFALRHAAGKLQNLLHGRRGRHHLEAAQSDAVVRRCAFRRRQDARRHR